MQTGKIESLEFEAKNLKISMLRVLKMPKTYSGSYSYHFSQKYLDPLCNGHLPIAETFFYEPQVSAINRFDCITSVSTTMSTG